MMDFVVIEKTSAQARKKVQEVVYFAAAICDVRCKVEYVGINQEEGAEMGTNEDGVFVMDGVCAASQIITDLSSGSARFFF
uniref:Uncharacterized protein n=1 Tax=Salvator merianae TaxID=96440 RepID=A0A8D0BNE4_SALMN